MTDEDRNLIRLFVKIMGEMAKRIERIEKALEIEPHPEEGSEKR